MRKIFKNMAWTMAATLVMAACSDSLDESDSTGQGPLTGEGYVKVAINMPTTSGNSTRSTDNDEDDAIVDLEDGEANEYNVENAILAFFKCNTGQTPETEATFVKAYALSKTDLAISGSTETPQVTEQVSVITEAPKVDDTQEQLYVLAILNYNSSLFTINNGTLTVSGNTVSKLSDLQKKISTTAPNNEFVYNFTGGSSSTTRNQFTMTNAPLSDKPGNSSETISGAKAYTLVPVTVYDTKAQAINGDVAKIYVERVVAKVTLKLGSTHQVTGNDKQIKVTEADGTDTKDIVEITGWCLNVTNNSTKLVRDVTNFNSTATGWLYTANSNGNAAERFAGTKGINASFGIDGESSYYRIYWAQDCNYVGTGSTDVTTVATDFTTYYMDNGTVTPQGIAWNDKLVTSTTDNACYCLENTMDFSQQMDDRTTGVLIKTDYYTFFQGDTKAQKRSFFICGTSSTKYPEKQVGEGSALNGTDAFVDYVMGEADKLITTDSYKFKGSGLTIKTTLPSGTYTNVTDVFDFTATSDALIAQQAAVNAVVGGRISYYKDGENYYYSSLIRHFQDDEGVSVPAAGVTSASDYTLKHLGRYGVVRNNWYEISINSVSGPGDPTIVPPGGNPDDEAEGYINCTINVLSWAKRSQGVDL